MKFSVIGALAAIIAVTSLSGCASVVEGTTQEVMVNTNPPGADCVFVRGGRVIARVPRTPGSATIKKTRDDITVRCDALGYQPMTYLNRSGLAAAIFGNALIGGMIGVVVDIASGSANKYDGEVDMVLPPSLMPMEPPPSLQPLPLPPLPPQIYAPLTQ